MCLSLINLAPMRSDLALDCRKRRSEDVDNDDHPCASHCQSCVRDCDRVSGAVRHAQSIVLPKSAAQIGESVTSHAPCQKYQPPRCSRSYRTAGTASRTMPDAVVGATHQAFTEPALQEHSLLVRPPVRVVRTRQTSFKCRTAMTTMAIYQAPTRNTRHWSMQWTLRSACRRCWS